VSQLTVGLMGNAFGVDFNPAANRLRVVSDLGQNLSRVRFGVTQANRGLATVSVLGRYGLFQVDLLTGRLGRVGGFRAGTQVVDIAIPLDQG
jgi:hypothetical protein